MKGEEKKLPRRQKEKQESSRKQGLREKLLSWSLNLWPLGLIVLVVLFFFYPVWLRGLVPLPADFVAGVYFPWLDYKWGFPTGVPVKNPITTDVVSFMYPMQIYAIELLKSGNIPLWNPLIFTGTPLLANFQSAPFSPLNFTSLLFPNIWSWTSQMILQPILGAFWVYLLLRYFNLNRFPSVVGGLIFSFSGFMMIWLQWNGHSLAAGFIPLLILLLAKFLDTYNIKYGILISLVLAIQLLSGYPQVVIYSFLAMGLYYLIFNWRHFFAIRTVSLLAFFSLLGLSLAALQVLPGYELLKESQRQVEELSNDWAFLPWEEIVTFFAPDYFGNHATGNYWGPTDYTTTTGYSGVVAWILASLAFIVWRKKKEVIYLSSLVLVGVIIAFPTPISVWFKESGLFGLQAASAHRALILVNLGVACLASFGLERLLKKDINFKDVVRSLYLPGIFLLAFGIITLASFLAAINSPDQTERLVSFAGNMKVGLRNLVLPAGLLFLGGLSLFVVQKRWLSARAIVLFLGVIAVLELFRFGWKFTPFSPPKLVYPETPVIEFLKSREQPSRVYAENVVPINMMMAYGIETVEGYDAVYPLRWAKYLSALNAGKTGTTPMGRYGSISRLDSHLLNLANARYILTIKRDNENRPHPEGEITERFNLSYLQKVFEDKTVVVLENERALPRAFMVYDWEVIEDEEKQLARLLEEEFLPTEKVILASDPGIGKTPAAQFSLSHLIYKPNETSLKVSTSQEGILFVSDAWYPGWKVFVDGVEKGLFRANYTFRGVVVPEGEHNIRFIYAPQSFTIGKWLSLATAAALAALFIASLKYDRRTKKSS